MTHIQDAIRDALGTPTDHISSLLLEYYQDRGATSANITDAEMEFLAAQGYTTGHISDRWNEFLGDLGYTGSLSDRLLTYWQAGIYNFYVAFTAGVTPSDLVSGETLTTVTTGPHPILVNGTYIEYGDNTDVVNEYGLNTYGAYTLLNGKTNDVSDSYWDIINNFNIIGSNCIQGANSGFNEFAKAITTIEGALYTLSFYAYVESGGQTGNYRFRHLNSATGNETALTLSETRARYDIQVLGRVGGGNISFGVMDRNTSNWAKLYIDTINVTKTDYLYPEVQNDTTSSVTISQNNADASEGTKAVDVTSEFPQLLDALGGVADGAEQIINGTFDTDLSGWSAVNWTWDAGRAKAIPGATNSLVQNALTLGTRYEATYTISGMTTGSVRLRLGNAYSATNRTVDGTYTERGVCVGNTEILISRVSEFDGCVDNVSVKEVSDAQGTITFDWTPWFDTADVSGHINIFTANDETDTICYYDADTSEIKIHDGTNTAVKSLTVVAGTTYSIQIDYGTISGTQMRIGVDDVLGTAVTFTGSFPVTADDLSFGWDADEWQSIKNLKIYKEIQ